MKSTIKDVRDYLCKALAELADSDATAEDMALKIERAKATSNVASQYIGAVKLEIEAAKLYSDTGLLPCSVEQPEMLVRQPLRAIGSN